MSATWWPPGSDPRDVARSQGASELGKALLARAGLAPTQPVSKAPFFAGIRKGAAHSLVDDLARAGSQPLRFTPKAAEHYRKAAEAGRLALLADEAVHPLVRSILGKRAEAAADGLSAPSGRGPSRGNYPFASQAVDDDRGALTEPKGNATAFDWETALRNPDFADDGRALAQEFAGALHMLSTTAAPGVERQALFDGATFIPLRRLINRMESAHGFDVTALYRQLGVSPPKSADGHGDEDGGQDFTGTHEGTTPGTMSPNAMSWDDGTPVARPTDVPDYDPTMPYPGKAASLADWAAYGRSYGQAIVDRINREALGKAPAGGGRTIEKSLDLALACKVAGQIGDSLYRDIVRWRSLLAEATASARRNFQRSVEVRDVVERIEANSRLSASEKRALAGSLIYA